MHGGRSAGTAAGLRSHVLWSIIMHPVTSDGCRHPMRLSAFASVTGCVMTEYNSS